MQINEYVELASMTNAELGSPTLNNIHMILGMLTETGELADVFKKNIAYGKEIDWINVQEEMGDIFWYLGNFCKMNNFNLEDILANNIKKLQARYPNKFTKEDALNRNLEVERKVLEELNH
jgi:NTP pyrophosphatase (non-canonical NTP hydrolase)